MSATLDRAGDVRPVPGKRCRLCGSRGEWPGQPCPNCRSQSIVIESPHASPLVQAPADPSARLGELAAIANAEHTHVHLAGRELIEHAIRAGGALLEARNLVENGRWMDWAAGHVRMHITTAYRYMRMAEYRDEVLASEATSIEAAIQLLAAKPRRGHGPRGYSDADKADWIKLADEIGIKPAARALGISSATIHKWTSPNSPARGQTRLSREVTAERIERLADWLVARFGGYDYPERITAEVRVDAAAALAAVFAIEPAPGSAERPLEQAAMDAAGVESL